MFNLNCDLVMPGLMKLCSVFRVVWFLLVMNPLDETSKQLTVHLNSVMSVVKCAYLLHFSKFLVSIYFSPGQVSSKMCIFFFSLSRITMSDFSVVTHNSGGIDLPSGAVCRGKSLRIVNFGSTLFTI